MNEEFLSSLEAVLGVKHTKVSLTELWEKSPPESANCKSIADYLANVNMSTYLRCLLIDKR